MTDFMSEAVRLEAIRKEHLAKKRARDAEQAANEPEPDGLAVRDYLRTRQPSAPEGDIIRGDAALLRKLGLDDTGFGR